MNKLKNDYPKEGIDFSLTRTPPNYIGVNLDIQSDACEAYFNGKST